MSARPALESDGAGAFVGPGQPWPPASGGHSLVEELRGPARLALLAFPLGQFPIGLFARVTVAFLQSSQELVSFPRDHIPVAIRQFPPLLLHLAFHLLPLTFYLVPIHTDLRKQKGTS